jgi:ATP-binding cassette subfamily E protein 1
VRVRSTWREVGAFVVEAAVFAAVQNQPDWQEILLHFRGSELQNYFTRMLEDDIKAIIKPQYVDHIPKAVRGNVEEVIDQKDQRGNKDKLLTQLDLKQV